MNIPNRKDYDDYEKYKLDVDKFFYERYGFRKWFENTQLQRIGIVEKLGVLPSYDTPVYPTPILEEDDNRCMTYRRYEKGGLR